MTKEKIIEIINKNDLLTRDPLDIYTSEWVTVEKISSILSYVYDEYIDHDHWYIEQLISSAGNGDCSYYCTYFDQSDRMIKLRYWLHYRYSFTTAEEVAEFIIELDEIFNSLFNNKDAEDRN